MTYRRVPIRLPKSDRAYRFCLIGEDLAGNPTPPLELPLYGTQVFPDGVLNAASLKTMPGAALAPGMLVTVAGVNFAASPVTSAAEVQMHLLDHAGAVWEVPVLYASPGQINALVPPEVALGQALLKVKGAAGEGNANVVVDAVSPGIFTASAAGSGAPLAFLSRLLPDGSRTSEPAFTCQRPGVCTQAALELPKASDRVALSIYVTGLARVTGAAELQVFLSGLPLEDVSLLPAPAQPGVEVVGARLPAGFSLQGYLPLVISAAGKRSNTTYLRFRAPI